MKPKVLKVCKNCGKEVWKYQSQIKNSKMIFCSQECQHKWRTGKQSPAEKKGMYKKCPICGNEFYCYPSEVNGKKTCSMSCNYELQKLEGIHTGENCNFWAGGFEHYRGPNWMLQRSRARKRDKNICQICGKTEKDEGKKLTVHHVVPFRFFSNDYKKANDLENLITICSECHGKAESHGWLKVPEKYEYLLKGVIPQEQVVLVRKYSEWEVEYIKENYKELGPRPIAEYLKRPLSSVADKANNLGLKKNKQFFSDEEIKLIKKHYSTSTKKDFEKLLPNRNYNTIKGYANKLGIVKSIPSRATKET